MRLLSNLHLGGIRQNHPHRNLQTPARGIDDRDRAVSLLRSADNLKSGTVEWMELIEDLDLRVYCAQGTLGVGALTRTCIV